MKGLGSPLPKFKYSELEFIGVDGVLGSTA